MYDVNESVCQRILEQCQQHNLTLHGLCAVSGITWSSATCIHQVSFRVNSGMAVLGW